MLNVFFTTLQDTPLSILVSSVVILAKHSSSCVFEIKENK